MKNEIRVFRTIPIWNHGCSRNQTDPDLDHPDAPWCRQGYTKSLERIKGS
jgi:hypothetical protein